MCSAYFFFFNNWMQTVDPTLQCKFVAGKIAAKAGSDLGLPLASYQKSTTKEGSENANEMEIACDYPQQDKHPLLPVKK